jgi:26S proteasome regulatory subunit T4
VIFWIVTLCSLVSYNIVPSAVIVKATNGPRYVVGCRRQLDKAKLKSGTRVALDMTTLTIMRYLPREVDPLVYNMSHEDPGDVTYSAIGGLSEQIRELREVCT